MKSPSQIFSNDPLKALESSPSAAWLRPVLKAVVLLLVILGLFWAIYASPLRQSLTHIHEINAQLSRLGFLAPLIFTLGVAILVGAGCSRLLLCSIGGMVFGFWEGLLWTQLGALIGSYLMFLFVRWGGQELVLRHWPRLGQLNMFMGRRGILTVILTRQLPVGGIFLNIILGLTPVRHLDFLLGTVIGNLPEAIPCTLIGSSALQLGLKQSIWQIALAVSLLLLVWLGIGLYLRASKMAAAVKDKVEHAMETKDTHVR